MVEARGSNDVVVALSHLHQVRAALDEAGQRLGGGGSYLYDRDNVELSGDLGLARIPLLDLDRAAVAVADWASSRHAGDVSHGIPRPAGDRPALDRLLWHLRAGFAAQNGGWAPTIGKNRAVGRVPGARAANPGVSGAGEISHGGGGSPTAVNPPAWAERAPDATPNGVRVGLVDTEMVAHPYLVGTWVGPYRRELAADRTACAGPGRDGAGFPDAERGHATFIAGLIHRYAPRATLHVYPALDTRGESDTWTVAHRMIEAGRAGVDVLNLSFVCYTDDAVGPMVLAAALDRLNSDIVVVCAAGNHGFLPGKQRRKPAWPAAFPNVIAVGATAQGSSWPADFTPRGQWINVLAPGENVVSTFLSGKVSVWRDPDGAGPAPVERQPADFSGYASWSGTSYAAAIVSGLIANGTEPGRTTAGQAAEALLGATHPVRPGPGAGDTGGTGPAVIGVSG